MGAFHQIYPATSLGELMWGVYQFLVNPSQTVMQVVNDGTPAVFNGTGYVTPTGAADFAATGSFIVCEPTFANPSGLRRWQVKMTRTAAITLSSEGSPNGGFSTGTSTFGSQPTTGNLQWMGGTLGTSPAAGDTLYLSSDDSDTYDGGTKKYGWFRGLFRDLSLGLGIVQDGFYYGGYIPFDVANDTDPFILLGQKPWIGGGGSAVADYTSWGNLANTNSICRTPVENGLAIASMVSAGYAGLSANRLANVSNMSKTRNSTQVEMQVFIHTVNSQCLGYFGENTMVAVADDITNWSMNTGATRLKVNSFGHSWV